MVHSAQVFDDATTMRNQDGGVLRHRRLHRFREVVTGLFGLIIVLGGFSLTDVPIRQPADLVGILCYFVPMFLFIVSLWTHVGELIDVHPPDDRTAERSLTAVLFFATLVPVALRVGVVAKSEQVSPVAFDFFPIALAIVLLLLAYTSHRLVQRDAMHLHPEDNIELQEHRDRNVVTAIILFVALLIPPSAELFGFSAEGIAWGAAFLASPFIVRRLRKYLARRRPHHAPPSRRETNDAVPE